MENRHYNLSGKKKSEEVLTSKKDDGKESPTKKRKTDKRKKNLEKKMERNVAAKKKKEQSKSKRFELREFSDDNNEEEANNHVQEYKVWSESTTIAEFLTYPLPLLSVTKPSVKKSDTQQDRAHPRTPQIISHWSSFESDVLASYHKLDRDLKMQFFSWIAPDFQLSNEIPDVQGKIGDICHYMNKIFQVRRKSMILKSGSNKTLVGEPDFYLDAAVNDDGSDRMATLGFIEAKNPFVLPMHKNLLDRNEQSRCRHTIRQVYGYLALNGITYGVLSSYNITYFLWRSAKGTLKISSEIKANSTNPTLLQCLYHWCDLTITLEENILELSAESPQHHLDTFDEGGDDDQEEDDDEEHGGSDSDYVPKRDSAAGEVDSATNSPILSLMATRRYVGQGASGKVFAVKNNALTLKVVDIMNNPKGEECLLQEIRVYKILHKLKLPYVPKFYFAKCRFGQHFLAMEYVDGTPCTKNTLKTIQNLLRRRLNELKKHGIYLKDVRKENILMINDGTDFKLVDFGICDIIQPQPIDT